MKSHQAFIDTALEDGLCMKCDQPIMAGLSGGFNIKLDRILLSKFEELQIQMGGRLTYRLETSTRGIIAKARLMSDLRSGIHKSQPLIVALHDCKGKDDGAIPF